MGEAVERLFLPLVKKTIPEIVDMHLPVEGIFHNLMIVAIDKRYPGPRAQDHARDLGNGPDDVHQDHRGRRRGRRTSTTRAEVLWSALTAIDPERDVELVRGPVDELDFASRLPCYGSKIGIDATRKWKEEGFERPLARPDRHEPGGQGEDRRALARRSGSARRRRPPRARPQV